jgi:hypothetical protein
MDVTALPEGLREVAWLVPKAWLTRAVARGQGEPPISCLTLAQSERRGRGRLATAANRAGPQRSLDQGQEPASPGFEPGDGAIRLS